MLAGLPSVDSEVRPVIFDRDRERTSLHRLFFSKIFGDVERPGFVAECDRHAPLVPIFRRCELNFCSGASAFCGSGNLLLRCVGEGKNRFFDVHCFRVFGLVRRLRTARSVTPRRASVRCWPDPCRKSRSAGRPPGANSRGADPSSRS